MASPSGRPDIVCLSHLRWGGVHQRPHHLMERFGRRGRVLFCEEPVFGEASNPRLEVNSASEGVFVLQPWLPAGLEPEALAIVESVLLNALLHEMEVRRYVLWYYSPLALRYTEYFAPLAVVYDRLEALDDWEGPSAELLARDRQLLTRSDLIFTAGHRQYLAGRQLRRNVHAFPNGMSWDRIGSAMDALLLGVVEGKEAAPKPTLPPRQKRPRAIAGRELRQ